MSDLPIMARGDLPANYMRAKEALAECERIDECQEIKDRAQLLASYANQVRDNSLLKMARRIQSRAAKRVGELLKEIPSQAGKRTDLEPDTGDRTRLKSKTELAAEAAGLSKYQKDTSIRIANIPKETFEKMVESSDPPTMTHLATMIVDDLKPVKKPKKPSFKVPDAEDASLIVGALIDSLAKNCEQFDAAFIQKGMHRIVKVEVEGQCLIIVNWIKEYLEAGNNND